MISFLVNKYDFFGPARRNELSHLFNALPDNVCVCSDCFFADAREANYINRRAIENGREITRCEDLPAESRPTRCDMCGRRYQRPSPAAAANTNKR